jgi:myo-inositol-1(or 4)-monophosphatase
VKPHESLAGRESLLTVALAAAREAAAYVHAGWRTHPHADHKASRVDLVTAFDRESERMLRERLHRETPYAVVGEEQGPDEARASGDVTWFVDPLDGTTNFVHGHPFYCVSIGLLAGEAPIVGAVVAPALATEWSAVQGGVARRNGDPCCVSRVQRFTDALLATGFPYDRSTSEDNNFDAFVAIKRRAQAVRRCGSAAMDLCLVADGTYDGYWEKKLAPWDCVAGAAIVLAAGGRVSDYGGGAADLLSGQLLATNGAIHDSLVAELQTVPSTHLPPAPRYRR